jgi:LuxR family transcriptional regulator, maltose regulon positive regulatory protein
MSDLLTAKLRRPSISSRRVARPHLIRQLKEGLELGRQITLVSAPAGFGKTTCISEWINTLERYPVSWLSLDASDDDPVRFFHYFIAALQKADPHLGKEIEGVLRSGQLPPPEVISTTLCNDILELDSPFLLVLDDFHAIQDRLILQVLERLLANWPQPLHLVLLTREDPPLPLARLRANDQMTEIRAGDLRFNQNEAGRYLNEIMGLSLSSRDIAALEDRTEGWVVGLQLAGISIRGRADPSDFISNLSGSHRFILSYLSEEVLNRQPDEIRQFLLETSVLDKLNADLCDALTGRSDSYFILQRLFNANLFLIPLDDEGQWYRYHHLFADLLRDLQNALQKDKTIELHRRASRWYVQVGGEQGTFVNDAIRHALAAEDYALVVELLERHALDMIMQGYAKTVNAWVQTLPAQWSSQSPRTNLAFAWMHLLRGTYSQASHYLERLEVTFADAAISAQDRRSLKAEWLVMQSLSLSMKAQITESLALVEQALELAPREDSRVLSLVYFGLATVRQAADQYDLAVEAYQRAIQYGRAAEYSVAEMLSISGLAQSAFDRGQLHLALEIASPACARVEQSGSLPPISMVVFGILGEVYYQWVQIEQARRNFQRALQLSILGGFNSGITNCRVLLSRLYKLEGDLEAAAREIQHATDMLQVDTPEYVHQEVVAQQVRIYLARERPAAAEMALQGYGFSIGGRFSFPDLSGDQNVPYSPGMLFNSGLHFLLYQAWVKADLNDLRVGIDFADRLIRGALRGRSLPVALETLLLRAQMHALLGDQPSSQADYVKGLELAQPEGFIGVFIEQGSPVADALADLVRRNQLASDQRDFAERILATFSQTLSISPEPGQRLAESQTVVSGPQSSIEPEILVEPLTDREMDVLRLIAEGLKYKEIAAYLFVSLNTVRFHVKSIYGKLNVNNRTQAIETARQLHIL